MAVAPSVDPRVQAAVHNSIRTLRQLADYRLPPALDLYIQELGERKEFLDAAGRDQLAALVCFTQERSAAKLQAELALRQLLSVFPEETSA